MLTLNNLKSPKGSHRDTKRIGRGQGSGQGTQAGKGHKGQKARSGGGVRPGFEGGNMPLYMRLPKTRLFTNAQFKKNYATVDLALLSKHFEDGDTVSRDALIEKSLLKGSKKRMYIKILAKEKNFSRKLTFVDIDKFSESAKELISRAGGKIQD